MVRLNRIYTRSGDAGETGLGDGTRVPKTDPRIEAYGTVDELNAVLGLCLDRVTDERLREGLLAVQNDLFDLGADLCVPATAIEAGPKAGPLRIFGSVKQQGRNSPEGDGNRHPLRLSTVQFQRHRLRRAPRKTLRHCVPGPPLPHRS